MYLAAVILLMLVLPAASVAIEALRTPGAADLANGSPSGSCLRQSLAASITVWLGLAVSRAV